MRLNYSIAYILLTITLCVSGGNAQSNKPVRHNDAVGRLANGEDPNDIYREYHEENDYSNALFCASIIIKKSKSESRNRSLIWDAYHSSKTKNAKKPVLSFFRDIITSDKVIGKTKIEAASVLTRTLLENTDSDQLILFLDKNRDTLEILAPKEFLLWKLKAHIYAGEYTNATKVRNLLINKFDDIEEDSRYVNLNRYIGRLRRDKPQISVEIDISTAEEEAKQLLKDGNALGLIRFIRSVIDDKRSTVITTDDEDLHVGALPAYRRLFAPYRKLYKKGTKKHLELLKDKLKFSEQEIERKAELLSLDPTSSDILSKPGCFHPSSSSVTLPKPTAKDLHPLLSMSPGENEIRASEGLLSRQISKEPPAGLYVLNKNTVFFQNSRQISRINGEEVIWSVCKHNSSFKETPDLRTFQFGNRLTPVADDKSVYARLIDDGVFKLMAIDLQTGSERWTWNESEYVVCSDPTLWQNYVICLIKRNGPVPRYFIALIDRVSGNLKEHYFLYSAINRIDFHQHISYLHFDSFLPIPVIRDSIAYIASSAGLVLAFDLKCGNMLWTRTYKRTPYTVDKSLAAELKDRLVCPPVVGSSNVLFVPIDSSDIMLLDRASGKLLASESRYKWRECRQLDAESVILTEKNGDIHLLSLANPSLSIEKTIPGNESTIIQNLENGILIERDHKIEMRNHNLNLISSVDIPANYSALALVGSNCFGYDNTSPFALIEMLANAPRPKNNIAKAQSTQNRMPPLSEPHFFNNGRQPYIIADNYIVKLKNDLLPQWSVPVFQKDVHLYEGNTVVYLVSDRHVRILNKQSGSMLFEYPQIGKQSCKIEAARLSNGDLLFAAEPHDNSVGSIVRATANGFTHTANTEKLKVKAILDNGKTILACDKNDVAVFRYSQENEIFKIDDQAPRLADARYYGIYTHLSNDSFLHVNEANAHVLTTSQFTNIPIRKWDDRVCYQWYYPNKRRKYEKLMAYGLYQHHFTLLDTEKKRDLSALVQFSGFPVRKDNSFIGIMRKDRNKREYTSIVFSTNKQKITRQSPINPPDYFTDMSYSGSYDLFNNIYHFFNRHHRNAATEELGCIRDDLKTEKLQYTSFPSCRYFRDVISKGSYALLLIDNEALRFTQKEFKSLLNGKCAPVVSIPVVSDFDNAVDGYPDEWNIKKFHLNGSSAFYGKLKNDKLIFAGIISEPGIVKSLAQHGAGDNLHFTFMPGGRAGFSVFEKDRYELAGHCAETEVDWQFAYSIPPAGTYCFIEMEIPLKHILKFSYQNIKKIPTRNTRGDIAFEFLLNNDGEKTSLFAPEVTKPVFFPRLKFDYPEQD